MRDGTGRRRGDDLLAKYPDEAALLARAEGIGYNGTQREGIVIRPQEPVRSETLGGPLSMKVLNNRYLLKNEEQWNARTALAN